MGVDLEAGLHVEISSKEDDDHRHGALLEAIRALRRVQPIYRRLILTFQIPSGAGATAIFGPSSFGPAPPVGHVWLVQNINIGHSEFFGLGGTPSINIVGLFISPTTPVDGSTQVWGTYPPSSQVPVFYSFSREDLLVRAREVLWGGLQLGASPSSNFAVNLTVNVLEYPDVVPLP